MSDIKQTLRAIRTYSKHRYWETLRHKFTPEQQQAYEEAERFLAMANAETVVSFLVDQADRGVMSNLFSVRESPPKPEAGRKTLSLRPERQAGEPA